MLPMVKQWQLDSRARYVHLWGGRLSRELLSTWGSWGLWLYAVSYLIIFTWELQILSVAPLKTVADFHRLLSKIIAKGWRKIGYLGLSNIRIYPHTLIHEIALQRGLITKQTDLLAPNFYNPPPLSTVYTGVKCARRPLDKMLRAFNPPVA